MCFASQTPGLYSALISLRLPYPVCTRFICHVLCASPHKCRVCVVLLISLRLPCPVCTRFIYHVLCASPHYHRFCAASLFSSPALHSSLFILSVCFAPKTVQFYFPWDFCSLMRLLGFSVIFSVSFTLSKLFRGAFIPIPALQFCMLCLFCFSFMLYSVFSRIFFFPRSNFFAALSITSRALLPFVYHLLPLKLWLCVGFFSPLQV